ncbi:hypothetical protein ILYODFUR_034079 [Ilyodon furcidens]|uniref:Uncharacterized protein n=1 Tax=Ilyodon furcidens TaxID=33524 RepID=A0ABV0VJT2_9TELE
MSLPSSPVSSQRLSAHLPVHPPTLHAFWQLCCSYDHRKPTGNDSTSPASPSSPHSVRHHTPVLHLKSVANPINILTPHLSSSVPLQTSAEKPVNEPISLTCQSSQ